MGSRSLTLPVLAMTAELATHKAILGSWNLLTTVLNQIVCANAKCLSVAGLGPRAFLLLAVVPTLNFKI